MPVVNGTLKSFGLASINALNPRIIFEANKAATGTSGQLFATQPVVAIPASDTSWSVTLQDTSALVTEDVYYTVTVEWRDAANNMTRADFPDWKLYVPSAGGSFGDLIKQPTNPAMTIVSPTNPGTNYELRTAWLQMDPADPDNPNNPANTGDYYELENV